MKRRAIAPHEAWVTQRPGQLHGSCPCGWVAEAGHATLVRTAEPLPEQVARLEYKPWEPGAYDADRRQDAASHGEAFRDARKHVATS